MFGQKPNIVESRIMSTTYGFGTNHRFNPEGHPVEKKQVIEGVDWCKDCFVAMVKENDKVRVEETRKFLDYQPLQASQTSVSFKFYNSTNPNAKYIRPMMPWVLPLVRSPSSHQTSQEEPTERSTSASRLVEQRSKPQQ